MLIYNKQGTLIRNVEGAVYTVDNQLMGNHTVTISYSSTDPHTYSAGSYVDITNEGRFYLKDDYLPTDGDNGYIYEITFYDFTALFEQIEFYFLDSLGNKQYSWALNANLNTVVTLIADAINRDFPNLGVTIGSIKPDTPLKDLSFDGVNVLQAIQYISGEFEIEWWSYGKQLNFNRAIFSSDAPLVLSHTVNIRDNINVNYDEVRPQYIRAFGGTTNMPITADNAVRFNGRVPMPRGFERVEIQGVTTNVTHTKYYDDVYPTMKATISAVRYNGDAKNPIYYIRVSGLGSDFKIADVRAEGKVPKIRFESGNLNGRDYEVDDTESTEYSGFIEIFRTEQDGVFLPSSALPPTVGDKIQFWDVKVAESAISEASQRLKDVVLADVEIIKTTPPNIDGVVTNGVHFLNNPFVFKIGQAVTLSHPSLIGGVTNTRISGYSYDSEYPTVVTLSMDSKISDGRISEVEGKIAKIEINQSSFNESHTHDTRYLRKDTNDVMRGNLEIATQKSFKSTNFDSNLRAGFNLFTDANGRGILQCNKIEAEELEVDNLTYNTIRAVGGKIVVSKAWMTISRIEDVGTEVRFYYKPSDGMQLWRIGDQPRMANGGRFFWGLVVNVSDINTIQEEHFIACSKSILTGNIASVREADEFVLYGHRGDDATRKNLTLIDSGSADNPYPSIAQYYGIDSFDLSNIENKRPILISNKVVIGSEKQGMIIDPQNRIFKIIGINLEMTSGESVTVDDIVNKVDNIEIGGVNLVTDVNNWARNKSDNQSTIESQPDGRLRIFNKSGYAVVETAGFKKNGRYVLSFDIEVVGAVRMYASDRLNIITSNFEEYRDGLYFNLPNNFKGRINIYSNGISTGSVYIGVRQSDAVMYINNVMFERGTIATDWSPAPEDTQVQIASLVDRNNAAANDNIITIAEKAQLRNDWIELQKTYASLRESAISIGVSVSAVDAGYAGISEAFGSSWVNIGLAKDYTFPTSGALTKDNYLQRFSNWQVAVQQLSNDIAQKKVDNVEIGGVNYFANSILEIGDIDAGSGADVANAARFRSKGFTEFESTQATIGQFSQHDIFIVYYDVNKQYITSTFSQAGGWSSKYPFTVSVPTNTKYIRFSCKRSDGGAITQADLADSKFMVEKGNKATDYMPSIEDVQSEIDEAKKAGTDAQASADSAASAVVALDNTMNGSFKDGVLDTGEKKVIAEQRKNVNEAWADFESTYKVLYTNSYLEGDAKTNLLNAKITLAGHKDDVLTAIDNCVNAAVLTAQLIQVYNTAYTNFTSSVGSFKTALENANKAIQKKLDDIAKGYVDNIEIGGVNLLPRSSMKSDSGLFEVNQSGSLSWPSNEYTRYSVTKTTSTPGVIIKNVSNKVKLENGASYIVSCYVRHDNPLANSMDAYLQGKGIPVLVSASSDFVRLEFIYNDLQLNASLDYLLFVFRSDDGTERHLDIHSVQIERGNKATDWSPAPEDTQVQIDSLVDRNNAAANDNIITIAEKAQLRNDWIELQKTYARLRESAVSIGVSVTAVDAGYAGISEAFGSSWVNIGLAKDYTFPTSGALTKDNYLQRFSNWQVAVQQLSNDIAQKKVDNVEIGGVNIISNLPQNWTQGYINNLVKPPIAVSNSNYICSLVFCPIVDYDKEHIITFNSSLVRLCKLHQFDNDKNFISLMSVQNKSVINFNPSARYVLIEFAKVEYLPITPSEVIDAKIMLEKGNKPSSWAPSQEDTQSEIDQANKTPTYIGVFEDLTKPFYPINSKDRQDGVRYQSKFYKFTGASKTAISTWDSSQWTEWDMDGASFVNIATNTLLAEDAHLGNWRIKGNSIASKYTFDTDGEIPKAKMDGEQGSLDFHFGANKDFTCQNVRVFMGHKGLDGAGACSPDNDYPIFVRSMGDVVNGVYDYGYRTDISWGDVFVKGNKRSSGSQPGVNGQIFNDYSMYVGNTVGIGTSDQPAVGLYCEASSRGYGALIKELMVHGLNTTITTTTASSLVISTSATVINCTNTGTQTLTMPSYPSDGKLYIITKRSTAGTILLTVPSTQDGFTLSSGSNSTSININAGQSYLVQYSSISKRWNLTQL